MPRVDRHAAHAILGLLALVGVETVVNLVLEIYRPRTRGAAVRPLYESRLLGLFSQPGGLLRTAAHTLDYQFGFKVSGTWFYRYLERALAGLVLAQLAVVWLSTCLVLIEPHEDALLERWGRPVAARPVLGPGLHFKGPWPMDRALVFSSRELKSFNVGFTPDPELEKRDTLLWTRAHYKEELNLLVASRDATDAGAAAGEQTVPVNLITVSIPVQYRVTNLLEWAVGHAEGERLLPLLATREVAHYLVSVDLEEFMAAGRGRAAEELRAVIQRRANEARLGVEILFVGLQDVHPPVPVADAYEAVIAATQERETRVLDAQGYRAERLPRAQAEADRRILEQRGASVARISRAAAQAARFTNQIAAAHAAPAVFNTWTYHDTLTRALSGPRKFVIATTNSHQQFWLNLEDKLRPDLLDVPIPPAKEEKK